MEENIIIAVREKSTARQLTRLLRKLVPAATIGGSFHSVDETLNYLKKGAFADLIIAEVHLSDGKSYSLFDRYTDKPVIFISPSEDDAVAAFNYNALAYLSSPLKLPQLKAALTKYERIRQATIGRPNPSTPSYRQRFIIKTGNKLLIRTTDEVAYFYAEGKAVYLVSQHDKRKYIVDYTLDELERSLDPRKFFRISRKHIVCVDCIEEVRGLVSGKLQIKLHNSGDHDLDVSRERAFDFKKWLDL